MLGRWIGGWREMCFPEEDRTAVFDGMFRAGIGLWHERRRGGRIVCRLAERDRKQAAFVLSALGIAGTFGDLRGGPAVAAFCRQRPAIPLGILLTACWLWYSGGIVWDLRVEGNTKTPTETVAAQLKTLGFGVGTRFREVDFDQLHADYVAMQNDIAWLSVYMDGTVARVQVRELWPDGGRKKKPSVGANVTARESGVIEEVRVFEGEAAVRPGDFVLPGQVAISGVIEKKDGGFRWEYADGEVWAAVAVPLTVEIPLERTEYRPSGEEKTDLTIKIFEKTVNLSRNTGFNGCSYDTIDIIGRLRLPDGTPLPVWWEKTVVRKTEPVPVTLSAEEAAAEAMARMRQLVREETEDGVLIEKSFRGSIGDGVYRLEGLLRISRDIGEIREFTVRDAETSDGGESGT